MTAWSYVWLAGLLLIPALSYFRDRRRAAAIRELAGRSGFVHLGDALPPTFSLRGTTLESASSVWNVIDGEPHGTRVIVFDCRMGSGKGSWCRTVIAAQASADAFGPLSLRPQFTIERSDDWTILFEPKSFSLISPALMPVNELEAYMSAIKR